MKQRLACFLLKFVAMSNVSATLCQPVPAAAARGLSPRILHVSGVCLVLLAASACEHDEARSPLRRSPMDQLPLAPRQPPPLERELPRPCPAIACLPESFEVLLERSGPWPPGTYYLRASVDGGPRRVCSVVFEPVLGAAHDTCGGETPFQVHYRYDEQEQSISGVSFGQVHAVQLTVLTSDAEPPLLQVDHQLSHRYSSSSRGCGQCPSGPEPLTVRVTEPRAADAGSGDAGRDVTDRIPGEAVPGDAGSDAAL